MAKKQAVKGDSEKKESKEPKDTSLASYKKYSTQLDCLSTGIFALDLAIGALDPVLGIPGIRCRDIWEIYGFNNCFKSGTAEHMMMTTIKRYGPGSVVVVYSEPPDPERFIGMDVGVEDIEVASCIDKDSEEKELLMEASLEALLSAASDPKVKLCVVDSVAMLSANGELYDKDDKERGLGDPSVAVKAKVMNDFIARFMKLPPQCQSVLLLVNHLKVPISTGFSLFPSNKLRPETPGGRGMEFAAFVRTESSAVALMREKNHSVLDTKVEYGLEIAYKSPKNKYSHSTGTRIVKVKWDRKSKRINNAETVINYATFFTYVDPNAPKDAPAKEKIKSILTPPVVQAGAWFYIGKEAFQGVGKAAAWLEANPEILESLKAQIAKRSEQFFEDDKDFTSEYTLDEKE